MLARTYIRTLPSTTSNGDVGSLPVDHNYEEHAADDLHVEAVGNDEADASEPLTPEAQMLVMLNACRDWWRVNAKRPGLGWSFMIASDDNILDKAEDGQSLPRSHGITC